MVHLKVVYDGKLVALAAGIGFLGAFGAVCTCEQFRLATVNKKITSSSYIWIWLVACCFGGVCIWGMHFVGMSSFRLMDGNVEIPLRYDLGNAIMLLFITLPMTFAAVMISVADDSFNRSSKEIMEKFIARASTKYTFAELKQMSQYRILYIIFTHAIERPIIGGIISGGAVGLMHYVGMLGMRFQGKITYDPAVVFASCLTSVCVIIGGFWLFFRVLSLFPSLDLIRVMSACNGMFGISGLHYIGLQAARFDYDPTAPLANPHTTIDREQMLYAVLLVAVVYTVIIMVLVISDLRNWLRRVSAQLHHADLALAAIQRLSAGRPGAYNQIVRETSRYMRKHAGNTAVPPTDVGQDEPSTQHVVFQVPRMLYTDMEESDESNSDRTREGDNQEAGERTENGNNARRGGRSPQAGVGMTTTTNTSSNQDLTTQRSVPMPVSEERETSPAPVAASFAGQYGKMNTVMPV